MKSSSILLAVSLFVAGHAQAQSRPATKKPASKATTARSSTTKPISAPTVTRSSMVRPAATSPAPTAAPTNNQQSQYDQYHGVTKKPASASAVSVAPNGSQASRPTTKPAPAASSPTTPAERTASRPVTSSSNRAGNSSGIRIGVRGGATYPVYTEKLVGANSAVGFVGGLVFNLGRGTFSFQPELNYARYTVNTDDGTGSPAVSVSADQLEVPLFLKIASGSANSSRFFLNIGPYGAYLSGASINGRRVTLDGSTGRVSFGAAAGVGAALKAGPGHVTIELRGLYELGNTDTKFNTDSRVVNAQASVGYMIPLGGNR